MEIIAGLVFGVDEEVKGGFVVHFFEEFGVEDLLAQLELRDDHFVVRCGVELGDVGTARLPELARELWNVLTQIIQIMLYLKCK